ncbi:MAG: NAD+ synthase [Deltaproteobacteria bacterium]|nr:NAD+ synthase [Deltaproteobacteria bacterium]
MKIALAQIDPTVGDIPGNCEKIIGFHSRAAKLGADLVVFPELAVSGYPPLDLINRQGFVETCLSALNDLARKLTATPALVGCVVPNPSGQGRLAFNAAALLKDGRVKSTHFKSRLPSYDVFDEDRYFEPAKKWEPIDICGRRVGVTICEDIWQGPDQDRQRYSVDPSEQLKKQGIDLLINLSASPFCAGKGKVREELIRTLAGRLGVPVVLVNQVGGNDSLLFDGRSLAMKADGRLLARAEAFAEDLVMFDLDQGQGDMRPAPPEGSAELFRAIVMGIRDYLDKCGFSKVVLGLSGGIDSAVTAVLAAEAAGSDRVQVLAMPSEYSSLHSRTDAEILAKNLGLGFTTKPIDKVLNSYRDLLRLEFGDIAATLTEENLQARIRGALIMAFANHTGALALATGNKSELATGYCTLYGDMVGGLAPIGDLLKGQVYELASFINREEEIIPRRTIERPASAELRPDQTDQDSLPPYEQLDPILELLISEGLGMDSIVKRGYPAEVVQEVFRMVEMSEFKRRQSALVLRVTHKAFGEGRRIPIARGIRRGR